MHEVLNKMMIYHRDYHNQHQEWVCACCVLCMITPLCKRRKLISFPQKGVEGEGLGANKDTPTPTPAALTQKIRPTIIVISILINDEDKPCAKHLQCSCDSQHAFKFTLNKCPFATSFIHRRLPSMLPFCFNNKCTHKVTDESISTTGVA